jgi:hypothetical protein
MLAGAPMSSLRSCSTSLAALFGASLIFLSTRTSAAVAIDWSAPEDCDRRDRVLARVDELVGGVESEALAASTTVTRTAHGYRVSMHVVTNGQSLDRTFEGATCQSIVEASALVIAVLVEPVKVADAIADVPLPPVSQHETSVAQPVETPKVDSVPTPPRRDTWTILLGPRVGLGVGAVPSASAFGGAEFSVSYRRARFGLVGRVWIPTEQYGGPRQGAGVLVGLATLGPSACVAFVRSIAVVEACLGVDIGVQDGAGQLIRSPLHSYAPWLSLAPGFALRGAKASFPAFLSLDLPLQILRPTFAIDDYGTLYEAPILGFRAALGIDWSL